MSRPDPRISVVVITRNEESNIVACLASVKWADEIIVVDNESSDRTRELARRFTDRVYVKKMEVEGAQRNYAYSLAKNEWVLSLDADERVSEELKTEIADILARGTDFAAFSIPLRNYFRAYRIKAGGWYPAAKVRLFQKSLFRYEETKVHPRSFLDGRCGHLKSDIIHWGFRDFASFFDKLNRQTTLEAEKWFAEKRKIGLAGCLRKVVDRFFRSYFRKRGFRDGFIGLMLALGNSLYQIMSYAKYWEMKRAAGENKNNPGEDTGDSH